MHESRTAGDACVDLDLVFADEVGNPIGPNALTHRFQALRTEAGIRPGRLHDLRHSHATHLLASGLPVHVVSARLGHSSATITLQVYAHVLPRSDEQAAEAIARVLG